MPQREGDAFEDGPAQVRERLVAAEADEAAADVAVPQRRALTEQMRQEEQRRGLDVLGQGQRLADREPDELREPRESGAPACVGPACRCKPPTAVKLTTPEAGCRSRESTPTISDVPATSMACPCATMPEP